MSRSLATLDSRHTQGSNSRHSRVKLEIFTSGATRTDILQNLIRMNMTHATVAAEHCLAPSFQEIVGTEAGCVSGLEKPILSDRS